MSGIKEELLDQVSTYVGAHLGLHFPKEQWNNLERRLERAAQELGFPDAASWARHLLLSPLTRRQIEVLASHLTVGETYFFRDRNIFDLLESRILPDLIRKRRENECRLRIWSAGCATGEEPYSIAILLRKLIPDLQKWNLTLLATDINPLFLAKAAQGIYGAWSFREVPPQMKKRFFRETEEGRFSLLPELRKSVTFAYHNLIEDSYPSLINNTNAMDVIFCRNVLMYFAPERQRQVVGRLCRCLVEGGLLILSPTESSAALHSPLVRLRYSDVTLYAKNSHGQAASDETVPLVPPSKFQRPVPSVAEKDEKTPVSAPVLPRIPSPEEQAAKWSDPYQEALAAYRQGRHDEAEEKIALLPEDQRDAAPALSLLARIRANRGRLAEARDLCALAVVADKLNPGVHYLLATILQESGLTVEAAAAFRRAIYIDHDFVLAHFALGTLSLQRGESAEAERHFDHALSALGNYDPDEVLPESEGITAGRMKEIIMSTLSQKVRL